MQTNDNSGSETDARNEGGITSTNQFPCKVKYILVIVIDLKECIAVITTATLNAKAARGAALYNRLLFLHMFIENVPGTDKISTHNYMLYLQSVS